MYFAVLYIRRLSSIIVEIDYAYVNNTMHLFQINIKEEVHRTFFLLLLSFCTTRPFCFGVGRLGIGNNLYNKIIAN